MLSQSILTDRPEVGGVSACSFVNLTPRLARGVFSREATQLMMHRLPAVRHPVTHLVRMAVAFVDVPRREERRVGFPSRRNRADTCRQLRSQERRVSRRDRLRHLGLRHPSDAAERTGHLESAVLRPVQRVRGLLGDQRLLHPQPGARRSASLSKMRCLRTPRPKFVPHSCVPTSGEPSTFSMT